MKIKRNVVPTLVLGGCSLFGIGAAELAWNLLFPNPVTFLPTVIVSGFMVILGLILVVLANRMEVQEPKADQTKAAQ